jgi:hypothetical protein
MAQTVIALYDELKTAERVVRDLRDLGIPDRDISLVAQDAAGHYAGTLGADTEVREPTRREREGGAGAGAGAGIGAALGGLGGLLVGLGALAIPGIGPVVAAGPLATAISGLVGAGVGAVAGGAAGGLIGALVDMGLPEEEAERYTEGVRRGGTLVAVRVDDHDTDRVRETMNRHDPVDIDQRVEEWRAGGWRGFDPQAEPYSHDQTLQERERYLRQGGQQRPEGHADVPEAGRRVRVHRHVTEKSEAAATRTRAGAADEARLGGDDYAARVQQFRGHFQTYYGRSGYQYEHYEPAYQYGVHLAQHDRYRGHDWSRVEPDARDAWEERNPGTWDRIRDAVRYAFEGVRETARR